MEQDTVDAAIFCNNNNTNNKKNINNFNNQLYNNKKVPSIEALNSEMPGKGFQKEKGRRMLKTLLNRLRLRRCASVTISKPDPTYRVAYLGNVMTGWAKGEGCVEKPLATLWRTYMQSSRADVRMQLTVSGGGLKVTTKDHGLTEYWAHRLTTCAAPQQFPRLFCWVYKHEVRRLKHELRCHAVLCPTAAIAKQIESELKHSLTLALVEFKRDKISRQNARLSLANSVYENPTIPRRKILLSTGSQNYRPPLERSKSAPKLTSIEEIIEEEEDQEEKPKVHIYKKILRHYDSTSALLEKRKSYFRKLHDTYHPPENIVPVREVYDENQVLNEESERLMEESAENKSQYNDSIMELDEKSDMILEELVQSSLRNDLLESCERAWFNALGETPLDSDEGSLSSGCESASTVTSDSEPPVFPTITELSEEYQGDINNSKPDKRKTETNNNVDFKVGGCVLARVRSFEKMNSDILRYSGLNNSLYNNKNIIGSEEVSLVPVGESQSDFSSLKVFKKRSMSEPGRDVHSFETEDGDKEMESEGENDSACSDESGYEEEEISSSVANIVLV